MILMLDALSATIIEKVVNGITETSRTSGFLRLWNKSSSRITFSPMIDI